MVFPASRLSVGRIYNPHRDNRLRRFLPFGEQQTEALGIGFQQLEETQTGGGKGRVYGHIGTSHQFALELVSVLMFTSMETMPQPRVFISYAHKDGSVLGCIRSLMLVTCPDLLPKKALVPDLVPSRIGNSEFGYNKLHPKSLHESYQELITEAPIYGRMPLAP